MHVNSISKLQSFSTLARWYI